MRAVVGDEVTVILESHQAGSVAVGGRLARGPGEAGRVGASVDKDVAVAVEYHIDTVIKSTESTWEGREGSEGPSLIIIGPCYGDEGQ